MKWNPILVRARHKVNFISLIAATILVAVTCVAGIAVFVVMQHYAQSLLVTTLQQNLRNRSEQIELYVNEHVNAAVTIATRPFIIQQYQVLTSDPHNSVATQALNRAAATFLPTGLSNVTFYDASGRELARAGTELQEPELNIALTLDQRVNLLWKQHAVLRADIPIRQPNVQLGRVVVEGAMPKLDNMLTTRSNLGKTSEIAVCAPLPDTDQFMQCLPTLLSNTVFKRQPRFVKHVPLPMNFALLGGTGVASAKDYRMESVMAAYAPVGKIGLGMVLKIDTAELYSPIYRQLPYVLLLLLLAVIIGVFLLRILVAPLIRKVVESEHETKNALALLQDSETRVRAVLQNIEEGILTIDAKGKIITFNPAAERMFGYVQAEILGENLAVLLPELTDIRNLKNVTQARQHNQIDAMDESGFELNAKRQDGSEFPAGVRVSAMQLGEQFNYICSLRDLTTQKADEQKILHLATHDALTGLPNRNLLLDRLEQAILQAQRHGMQLAVMFIDLDNFKNINDSLGHDVGDLLLKAVAKRLSECVRDDDTVARQGGDEFIVVLTNIYDANDAVFVANKILQGMKKPYYIKDRELHTNASIGIAIYPNDGNQAEMLLKNSDTAMYHAKDGGRNTYQFFTEQMNMKAAERLTLENHLRRALERDEMQLYYQPIISLATNTVIAVEALLRWNNPALGLILPDRFIPIAEDSGLIGQIGEWVLLNACRQFVAWQSQGAQLQRVTVNLSPRQFKQMDMVENFIKILAVAGIGPNHLGLEVTESLIMENPETAIAVLNRLRGQGIELYLDDFGTGYSSLSYLKRFPIDKIKIDKSFVSDIAVDPNDEALVGAMIAMAHSLGVRVVAEGVESEAQLSFIRQHQCDECQGYFYSKPIPAHEMTQLLLLPKYRN